MSANTFSFLFVIWTSDSSSKASSLYWILYTIAIVLINKLSSTMHFSLGNIITILSWLITMASFSMSLNMCNAYNHNKILSLSIDKNKHLENNLTALSLLKVLKFFNWFHQEYFQWIVDAYHFSSCDFSWWGNTDAILNIYYCLFPVKRVQIILLKSEMFYFSVSNRKCVVRYKTKNV